MQTGNTLYEQTGGRTIRVRAFLERSPGRTTVRLWFVPRDRPNVGWFHEMDFDKALREELASSPEQSGNRPWSAFEASFFGPQLQELDALSRDYDERLLEQQLTRGTPPAWPESEPEPANHWKLGEDLQEAAFA